MRTPRVGFALPQGQAPRRRDGLARRNASEESVADVPTGGRSEPIARLGPTRPRGLVGKSRLFHLTRTFGRSQCGAPPRAEERQGLSIP